MRNNNEVIEILARTIYNKAEAVNKLREDLTEEQFEIEIKKQIRFILSLSNEKIDMLEKTIYKNKYIPWNPTAKQLGFLVLEEKEALFGGAAGGGKSIVALMGALQYIHCKNYSALILRRTYPMLSKAGGMIPLSHEWLDETDAIWNEQKKTWTFPSGATLEMGSMQHENNKTNYQGGKYNYVNYEELTQFTETQYLYLYSRMRKSNSDEYPNRIRSTANPGGVGHEWVKQRFIKEKKENRTFMQSLATDNPHLDLEDYMESLMELPRIEREALMNGNWDLTPDGEFFHRAWFEGKILDTVPAGVKFKKTIRYWDLAATEKKGNNDPDWTAGCLMGQTTDNQYYVLDIRRVRTTPLGVQQFIRQTAEEDGRNVEIWMEQEGGSGGKNTIDNYRRNVLPDYKFHADLKREDKKQRAGILSSQVEAGNIFIIRNEILTAYLNEIMSFPNGSHDDMVDATSGAFNKLFVKKKTSIGVS